MATAPILAGDIKLLASKIMDDVPNGGGGPTGTVIPDGASNAIFGDVTERARAGGSVSIRQLHLAVQTGNTSAFMDPSIIVSTPPNDANVSITLAKCDTFALRTAIANTIENYLIAGPVWPGFLFEGHVAGQRSIQLFQRPGTPTPTIGRTLALVYDEGKPGERKQFVRVTRVETVSRTFTAIDGKLYQADIVTCELTDALRFDFPGSPPPESFAWVVAGTLTRDTTVADAAQFFGVTPLSALAHVGDSLLRVASVYTQLVPSARSEVVALDQRPAAQRSLVLAESPRRIEVATAPHTQRIRVGQENRGFSFVSMLKPLPSPGTIVISYMALGNWYTIYDDGTGGFEGTGVGQVIYNTGSLSMTFPAMPDAGTSIIIQWGENTAYTSRAGQAGFRAPEFAWTTPQYPLTPGSVTVTWFSGGALRTATDNGSGTLTSANGSGEISYATGQIVLRPTAMIDAGGEFNVAYRYTTAVTESFPALSTDAGGFAAITLAAAPAPRSVQIEWLTVRNVSNSVGASDFVSKDSTSAADVLETRTQTVYEVRPTEPEPPSPWVVVTTPGTVVYPKESALVYAPGGSISMIVKTSEIDGVGEFTWTVERVSGPAIGDVFPVITGTVHVAAERTGTFSFSSKVTTPADAVFTVHLLRGGVELTTSANLTVDFSEPLAPPSPDRYTASQIGGLYNQTLAWSEKRWMSFSGPVVNGAYVWAIESNEPSAFDAVRGSFDVQNGDGNFWIVVAGGAPYCNFVVRVETQAGVVLAAASGVVSDVMMPPITGPIAALRTREPLNAGAIVAQDSSSVAIDGMFVGGVSAAGARVYVRVPPSPSVQWGSYYNPPERQDLVWSSGELSAKSKSMRSLNGDTVQYTIWG